MTRRTPQQAGFTLIEVLVAAFVLSIAVAALFLVSTRSLMLNSQAARLHGATLLAEDVFAAVQRTIYDNALDENPVFGSPLSTCQGGATCQMDIDSTLTTPFVACTPGACDPVVRNTEGFMVQNPADTGIGEDTGYQREIQMDLVSSRELLVTVAVSWEDRGRAYERVYTRNFLDWYNMEAYHEYGRVIATVVECASESDLPNWGPDNVGPVGGAITKTTAMDYVANNPNCWLSPDWRFQWGYLTWDNSIGYGYRIDETQWVDSALLDVIGPNDGSGGAGTYTYDPTTQSHRQPYTNEWRSFGNTDEDGRTAIIIPDPVANAENFALRIETKAGYVPFTYYFDDDNWETLPDGTDDNSAEMYCRDDIQNYDNYDYIEINPGGNVYYCVAFMAAQEPIEGDQCVLPTGPNITLVDFNFERIRANRQGPNQTDTKPVSLSAGNYRIKLQAYDGYAERVDVFQEHEYFFVEMMGDAGVVATTGQTADLEDNVLSTYWLGTVNQTLAVSADVTGVRAVHGDHPSPSADSVHAVCATFEALD